jgi:acyl-CoA dehydrogenase
MPINVTAIPGLPDHVNDVRIRTANFINAEILPRESQLFVRRKGAAVTEVELAHAKTLREDIKAKVKAAVQSLLMRKG